MPHLALLSLDPFCTIVAVVRHACTYAFKTGPDRQEQTAQGNLSPESHPHLFPPQNSQKRERSRQCISVRTHIRTRAVLVEWKRCQTKTTSLRVCLGGPANCQASLTLPPSDRGATQAPPYHTVVRKVSLPYQSIPLSEHPPPSGSRPTLSHDRDKRSRKTSDSQHRRKKIMSSAHPDMI